MVNEQVSCAEHAAPCARRKTPEQSTRFTGRLCRSDVPSYASTLLLSRRQKPPDQVPVPRIALHAGARVLEWFVLEVFRLKPGSAPIGQELLAIGGDQVRHRAPLPDMAVQPESTVHRVQHAVQLFLEF